MAKVYDALRRAEEERKRRAAGEGPTELTFPPSVVAPAPGPQAFEGLPEPRGRRPLWGRWLARRRPREIADSPAEGNKRRITLLQPESFVAEQFRSLRGRIDSMAGKQQMRAIVVTSPNPGDGKTTAAINLATVTALSLGRRVLLIDCDLRKPKVHLALGLRPEAGLAEVLTRDRSLEGAPPKVGGRNLEGPREGGGPGGRATDPGRGPEPAPAPVARRHRGGGPRHPVGIQARAGARGGRRADRALGEPAARHPAARGPLRGRGLRGGTRRERRFARDLRGDPPPLGAAPRRGARDLARDLGRPPRTRRHHQVLRAGDRGPARGGHGDAHRLRDRAPDAD